MSMDVFRDGALTGKSILVTGGGGGLGLEIGKALAAKGAKVHICGRRPQVLEDAAKKISGSGPVAASYHVCDVRDADQVEIDDGSDLGGGAFDGAPQQCGS